MRRHDPDADGPLEVLENELATALKHAADFEFMREHVVPVEVYLLGRDDLEFVQFVSTEFEIMVPYLPEHVNQQC